MLLSERHWQLLQPKEYDPQTHALADARAGKLIPHKSEEEDLRA